MAGVWGMTTRTGGRLTIEQQEARERRILDNKLEAHRASLRAAGFDPDYIGVTEYAQPCCPGCGKALPWAFLRRYR
jgi:hypothetical protein